MKSATEKIADPESRGVAERAHKMLQKDAGNGNAAENKILVTKDALAIFKTALGDKASGEEFDTVGLHSLGLRRRQRTCGGSLRPCGIPSWACVLSSA